MTDPGHHHEGRRTLRHYAHDFVSNWQASTEPLGRKLWSMVRNRARAFAPPFRGCCGRPGQPGC